MASFPFPLLSASVYSRKQHDLLLDAFIRPFWDASALKDAGGFFWTMRYGGGGEHLKLRFHGPEALEAETRQALGARLDCFIESLPVDEAEEINPGRFPPIDPEDEEEGLRPYRFWRWTTFRPSPFVLGAETLALDRVLTGLYAHAQSEVSEIVLREVVSRRLEASFATARQSQFIRLLIASFAAIGFSTVEQEAYLRHHRDWLVRFFISKARSPEVSSDSILAPLRARIDPMQAKMDAIRQRLITATTASLDIDPIFSAWQQRLVDFFLYVSRFRGNSVYDLDPYATDYTFLPLFKLFQGVCNQFGLRLSNELYVYQLLLTAASGGEV